MKLKPCPFCGKSVATLELYSDSAGCYQVICSILNDGCGASACCFEDLEEPVEAWNERVKELEEAR